MSILRRGFVLSILLAISLPAQTTKVSLKSQTRDFDLSGATNVRPFPVGSTLPSTCLVGQTFFRTDIAAGQNLHVCTAPNVWTVQGLNTILDPGMNVVRASNSNLTLGPDCSAARPCLLRTGAQVRSFSTPATISLAGGVGTAYIYLDANGNRSVAMTPNSSLNLSCSNCIVAANINDFPADSLPIFQWNATMSNAWDASGIDRRASLSSGRRFQAGSNIQLTESGSAVTISSTDFLPVGAVTNGSTLSLGGSIPASSAAALLRLGAASTNGSANGTMLHLNPTSSFTGDLAHYMVGGESRFRWTPQGQMEASNPGATITWLGNADTSANSAFRFAVGGSAATNSIALGTGTSRNSLIINGLGKVAIGAQAPSPSAADLLIHDATPTTGSTLLALRAGAGQNGNLQEWNDNSGSLLAAVQPSGEFLGGLRLQTNAPKPACAATNKGAFWLTPGANGTADTLEVCLKDAADTHGWRAIY